MDRSDEVLEIARGLIGPFEVVADLSWKDLGLSVVLEVRTADGRSLIVKSHNDDYRNQLEVAAYQRWVPSIADRAPELVAFEDGRVLVITKLDAGPPADELPPSVYADAGRVLRRFHGGGEAVVDPGWAEQRLANLETWIARMPEGLIAEDDVAFVEREAAVLRDLAPPEMVPCHSDFQPRNWRVDAVDGRVFVFDFEKARHDWWIHDIQRMWWREWLDRPDLRNAFLEGYGRDLDETELAGLRANSARGHLVQIVWATEHGDEPFADEGRRALRRLREHGL